MTKMIKCDGCGKVIEGKVYDVWEDEADEGFSFCYKCFKKIRIENA